MALQLLLETSGGLSDIRSVESAGIFSGQKTTYVLLPHSIVFLDAATGAVLHTFDFPKKESAQIVDCIYIEESRRFLVAFSNSTLAFVKEEAASTAGLDYTPWPHQPFKLLSLGSSGTAVVCADSTVWQIAFEDDRIPTPSIILDTEEPEHADTVCIGACSSGEFLSIVRRKQSRTDLGSGGDCVECSLATWHVPQSELGSSRTLVESKATIFNFRIRENEKFVNICPHDGFRSLSVLFSSPSAVVDTVGNCCLIRWLKYEYHDGTLLFERFLGGDIKRYKDKGKSMVNAIPAGPLMWFLYDGRAGLWDPRYGVELANIPTYLSHPVPLSPAAQISLLAHSSALVSPIKAPSSHLTCYYLTMCIRDANGTSNSVFQTILKVPSARTTGSICNALGRLRTPSLAATGKYFIKGHTVKMRVSQTSILSKLPVKMQNQLLNARKSAIYDQTMSIRDFTDSRKRSQAPIGPDHFDHSQAHNQYKKMKFTPQQWGEIVRSTADPVLDSKKEKVLYLGVPTPTVATFLEHFEALYHNAYPQNEDWDILHTLVISGTVSTAKGGPSGYLLDQAIRASRFDVLAVVCRYAPDLSERAAVHILLACAAVPQEDLEKLILDKAGSIRYQHHKKEVDTAPTEEGTEGKPARVHKGPRGKVLTHGQLMSVMMEHIIRRRVSYSTVLLSDVMRKLITPAFSVILLRVVMLFLKGLCAPLLAPPDADTLVVTEIVEGRCSNGRKNGKKKRRVETLMRSLGANNLVNVFKCISSHTGGICRSYNDEHVQGAITWAEALLDSHFSSLAFRASFDGPTRVVLGHVMDTVATASDASQEVERVLGLWVHVSRVIKSGGDHKSPSIALYQREKLRI